MSRLAHKEVDLDYDFHSVFQFLNEVHGPSVAKLIWRDGLERYALIISEREDAYREKAIAKRMLEIADEYNLYPNKEDREEIWAKLCGDIKDAI